MFHQKILTRGKGVQFDWHHLLRLPILKNYHKIWCLRVFPPPHRCKNCNYIVLYHRTGIFFILGAVSDKVDDDCTLFGSKLENFRGISWVEFIVPFSVSPLSDILIYCQRDNFRDGLDVMSIFPNFLLIWFVRQRSFQIHSVGSHSMQHRRICGGGNSCFF